MFIRFDSPQFMSEQDVMKEYPHSRYILQDIQDINHVAGLLIAVSTDKGSFRQICELRDELSDRDLDVALLGSYGGFGSGVLTEAIL